MFSRTWISKSTEGYSQKGERLKAEIQGADASLIGAGSGLSTSAGLTYGGERFLKYFSDFHEKYGITDMYSGGFYPFPSLEEYWAWWSRHIYCNRYDVTPGKPYPKHHYPQDQAPRTLRQTSQGVRIKADIRMCSIRFIWRPKWTTKNLLAQRCCMM